MEQERRSNWNNRSWEQGRERNRRTWNANREGRGENWRCLNCRYNNYAHRDSCRACKRHKGSPSSSDADKDGTGDDSSRNRGWKCVHCSTDNLSFRHRCIWCGVKNGFGMFSSSSGQQRWNCGTCFKDNFASENRCSGCRTQREEENVRMESYSSSKRQRQNSGEEGSGKKDMPDKNEENVAGRGKASAVDQPENPPSSRQPAKLKKRALRERQEGQGDESDSAGSRDEGNYGNNKTRSREGIGIGDYDRKLKEWVKASMEEPDFIEILDGKLKFRRSLEERSRSEEHSREENSKKSIRAKVARAEKPTSAEEGGLRSAFEDNRDNSRKREEAEVAATRERLASLAGGYLTVKGGREPPLIDLVDSDDDDDNCAIPKRLKTCIANKTKNARSSQ